MAGDSNKDTTWDPVGDAGYEGAAALAKANRQEKEDAGQPDAPATPAGRPSSEYEIAQHRTATAQNSHFLVQETPAHMTAKVTVDKAGQAVSFRGILTVDGAEDGHDSLVPSRLVIPQGASREQILNITQKYLHETGMFDQPGMAKDFLNPNGKTLATAEAFVVKAGHSDGDVDPYAKEVFASLKMAAAAYNDPKTPSTGGPDMAVPQTTFTTPGPGGL